LKISWTDPVNNEAVLHTVKEYSSHNKTKVNWIGHILCRNCLIKHIIEGKILGTRGRGKRLMQLLNDLKETRRYWKLKEEAQDRTLWRTQFGRGYGPVARQILDPAIDPYCILISPGPGPSIWYKFSSTE
jgi:hypothetical protein